MLFQLIRVAHSRLLRRTGAHRNKISARDKVAQFIDTQADLKNWAERGADSETLELAVAWMVMQLVDVPGSRWGIVVYRARGIEPLLDEQARSLARAFLTP